MSDAPDKSSKTEEPTQKRLDDAHSRGQFAKSQEIQIGFILGSVLLIAMLTAPEIAQQLALQMGLILGSIHEIDVSPEAVVAAIPVSLGFLAPLILPLGLGCAFAAIMAGGLQSGWRFTPKAIEPKWDKVSPLKGFKQKYSLDALTRFGIEFLKLIGIAGVITLGLLRVTRDPIFTSPVALQHLGSFIKETALLLLGILIILIGIIAAINFMYQKKKTHENLKMTRQEVKDERKQQEGDPMVRAAQRQMARQAAQQKMFHNVPQADFVVTNPTHFAVALRYRRDIDPAPIVLAKGADFIALRIRKIATDNGVPVIENPPVARMLYRFGQIDQAIPVELYQMTATVLAHVYKTYRNHRGAVARPAR